LQPFQASTRRNFHYQSIMMSYSTEWSAPKCQPFRFVHKLFLQFSNKILKCLCHPLLPLTTVETQKQNQSKLYICPLHQVSLSSDKTSMDSSIFHRLEYLKRLKSVKTPCMCT
jgi:predicted nucleotide-binding protein (sugar kinase/HSP70/actin superfamily)